MGPDLTALKRQAAEKAVEYVQPGMIIGLGVGSTAIWAVRHIGALLRSGALRDIVGIPCSLAVEEEARSLGIPLTTLDEHPVIDLTIDGADEIDPQLNLIKGGGGALTREKIVAQATRREVIVGDKTKLSPALGTLFALPIEVIPFGWKSQAAYLETLGAVVKMRQDSNQQPYHTNQGNLILDCTFGPIADPYTLAARIKARAGIVEHGLFLGMASEAIIASETGIQHIHSGEK